MCLLQTVLNHLNPSSWQESENGDAKVENGAETNGKDEEKPAEVSRRSFVMNLPSLNVV